MNIQLFSGVVGQYLNFTAVFSVESPAPEITAAPCTSLVLATSAMNSSNPVYSPATRCRVENESAYFAKSRREMNEFADKFNFDFVFR